MKSIGQVLLWVGFLSGSLATVFHSSQKGVEYVLDDTAKLKKASESLVVDIRGEKYTLFKDEASLAAIKTQLADEAPKGEPAKEVTVLDDFDQLYHTKHHFNPIDMSTVTVPEEGWNLIPWVWYLISAATCIAGIVVLFKAKSTEGQKSETSESSLAEINTSFDRLIGNIQSLANDVQAIPPSQITNRIDDQLADDFRIIAEGRESITKEFGLDIFADVMTQFAAGERAINRAWSAAADGYVDEADACINRGLGMLRQAQQILSEAKK